MAFFFIFQLLFPGSHPFFFILECRFEAVHLILQLENFIVKAINLNPRLVPCVHYFSFRFLLKKFEFIKQRVDFSIFFL